MRPILPKCDFLGPPGPDNDEPCTLPADWAGDPFAYLPERYQLSDEEILLAERYRNNDFSGGYFRSQIAFFRAPKLATEHERRRTHLASLRSQADACGVLFPTSFQSLAAQDEHVDRIRHNTIWFDLFPSLVDFPSSPECKLLQCFREGQGCDHWSLLLIPNGSHIVVYHSESLDIQRNFPGDGWKPDIAKFEYFECASSFDEWLAIYFLDCVKGDQHYAEMLKKYPGM